MTNGGEGMREDEGGGGKESGEGVNFQPFAQHSLRNEGWRIDKCDASFFPPHL